MRYVPGVTRWLMGDTVRLREGEETDESLSHWLVQTVPSHSSLSALKTRDVSAFIVSGHPASSACGVTAWCTGFIQAGLQKHRHSGQIKVKWRSTDDDELMCGANSHTAEHNIYAVIFTQDKTIRRCSCLSVVWRNWAGLKINKQQLN